MAAISQAAIAVAHHGLYDLAMNEDQQTTRGSTSDSDELRRRINQLEGELERYREHEHLVVKTLLSATSHATAIRESARREAELTLRKVQAKAEKKKTRAVQERDDARRELQRLRRITEQMRTGLSSLLTAKVEELRLETEEEVPAPEANQELDAVLGSAIEGQTASVAGSDRGGQGSSSRSPDGSP
jgi:cell division septum initiation protein DivIVA